MEEGILFCPNCGAPQIRVVAPESTGQTHKPLASDSAERTTYAGSPYLAATPQFSWSDALKAALVCGLLEALFSLFGLGIIAGGALCVALYRRRQSQTPLSLGLGARLGAISGGIAGLLVTIVMSVGVLAFRTGDQIRQQLYDSIEKAAARNPTPQAQEALQYIKSPEGFVLVLGLVFVTTLVIFITLSAFGGVLGATLFNKKPQ